MFFFFLTQAGAYCISIAYKDMKTFLIESRQILRNSNIMFFGEFM